MKKDKIAVTCSCDCFGTNLVSGTTTGVRSELITGIPGTKDEDLTDDYLQAILRGEKPVFHKRRTESQISAGKGLDEGKSLLE